MKSIFKYSLDGHDNTVLLPEGFKVLSVIEQYDEVVLYCLVDPTKENKEARFLVLGTGWEVADEVENMDFIGTISTMRGSLIWHVFKA